jgi:sulfoxide reductase heme-binding subunit YedZ
MRGSGFVAFGLLTLTACLGIANVGRLARSAWTRTVSALVHRNVSLLAVVFLAVHIVTALGDRYVKIPLSAVFVPGTSGYDPLWVGLGALSLDLMIAVVVTSLLRSRLRHRTWRLVLWLAYLSWPTALVHSLGSGSGSGVDTGAAWSTVIYVILSLAFGTAVVARIAMTRRTKRTAVPTRTYTPAPPSVGRPLVAASSAPYDPSDRSTRRIQ